MTNEAVRALEPNELWNHFADLNAIPRASKKEERVTAFIKAFGESLGLPTQVDHAGNVIIKKPTLPWCCKATWTWCTRRTPAPISTSTPTASA